MRSQPVRLQLILNRRAHGSEYEGSQALASAARSGAPLGSGNVRVNGSRTSDPVDTTAVGLLEGKCEPELLAHHASKEAPHRVRLPASGFHDGRDRGISIGLPSRRLMLPRHLPGSPVTSIR